MMSVKPIRTERDYKDRLFRLTSLMDAQENTPEADELEVLSILIQHYERDRFPIDKPSPLEAIRFRMEQNNLSPRDLEPFIGSRSRVFEVLSGARPLSMDMIRALHRHLGIPADALIGPEPLRERKANSELAKPAAKVLIRQGLLREDETLSHFLVRAIGPKSVAAMLRRSRTDRTNAKTDIAAVQAWCAGVLLKSRLGSGVREFSPSGLDRYFLRRLAALSARPDGPKLVQQELASKGIIFVVLPHLPGTYLDGAAMCRDDGVPVIGLTLRRDRSDNFWFTLFHEICHVKLHLQADIDCIVDDLEIEGSSAIEQEADRAAEDALIPQEMWAKYSLSAYASLADILDVAREAEVSPAVVAGRWQKENRDYRKFAKLLGHGSVRPLFTAS